MHFDRISFTSVLQLPQPKPAPVDLHNSVKFVTPPLMASSMFPIPPPPAAAGGGGVEEQVVEVEVGPEELGVAPLVGAVQVHEGGVEGERGRGFGLEPGGAFLPELNGGEADEVGDEFTLHERLAVLDPEGAALCPALGGIDNGVELRLDPVEEVHATDDDAGDARGEILLDAGA